MHKYKHTVYDLSNQILYDLCKKHPTHKNADEILAKCIIIGRTYAASLDRGKNKNAESGKKALINDDFYQKRIVPLFKNSKLDERIERLKGTNDPRDHVREILLLHQYLAERLGKINTQTKRSFCSKYLHFHLPHLFFIFDSRAQVALRPLVSKSDIKHSRIYKNVDDTFQKFFYKCLVLQKILKEQTGEAFSPREIDNYLLIKANKKLRKARRA